MPRRKNRGGRSRTTRGRKRGNRRPRGRNSGGSGRILHVNQPVAADRAVYRLRYPILAKFPAAASPEISARFTWNNAYDLDPTVGSTSMPGFTAASTLYTYYRVIGARYLFRFSNLEALPITAWVKFSNVDPGTSQVYAGAMGPHARTVNLGCNTGGNDVKVISGRVTPALIYGERSAKVESAFMGTVSGTFPTALQYLGFGAQTDSGANFGSGFDVSGWIEVHVQFFGLKVNVITLLVPPMDGLKRELVRQHLNILNALKCFREEFEQLSPTSEDPEALFLRLAASHTSVSCPLVPPRSLFVSALKKSETLSDEALSFAKEVVKRRPTSQLCIRNLNQEDLEMIQSLLPAPSKNLVRKLSVSKIDEVRYQQQMRARVSSESYGRPGMFIPSSLSKLALTLPTVSVSTDDKCDKSGYSLNSNVED